MNTQRNNVELMLTRFVAGESMAAIARDVGLSRERVRQLLKKRYGLVAAQGGFWRARRQRKMQRLQDRASQLKANAEARAARWYGISAEELAVTLRTAREVFRTARRNARAVFHTEWHLSLSEWWQLWQRSGHWFERGRNGYNLRRRDPKQPYSVSNCVVAPHSWGPLQEAA